MTIMKQKSFMKNNEICWCEFKESDSIPWLLQFSEGKDSYLSCHHFDSTSGRLNISSK